MEELTEQYTLPDVVLNDQTVARFSLTYFHSEITLVYVFPLPDSLNCQGDVSALRFCYSSKETHFDTEQPVMTLLTMRQSGLTLNITNAIPVHSTPSEQICTTSLFSSSKLCCDTVRLNAQDQFSLPSANFAFGIIRANSTAELLAYISHEHFDLVVEHYRFSLDLFPPPAVGNSYTMARDYIKTDNTLRLLQFVMGK